MSELALFETEPRMERDALVSEDGLYRYTLSRRWAPGPMLPFGMLNPSTASKDVDDPTTRRCEGFLVTPDEPGRAALTPERIEEINREVAADLGQRHPIPDHWKAAALLRGMFEVWPAPARLWRWIEDNSLHFPDHYKAPWWLSS